MFKGTFQSISGNPEPKLSVEIDYCFVLGQSVSLTALTSLALNLSTRDNQLPADPLLCRFRHAMKIKRHLQDGPTISIRTKKEKFTTTSREICEEGRSINV